MQRQELGAGLSRPLGPALGCCHGNAAVARAGCGAAPLARAAAGGARRGGRGVSSSRAARAGSAALSPAQRAERSPAAGNRRSNFVG